jgi:hypothetical protein
MQGAVNTVGAGDGGNQDPEDEADKGSRPGTARRKRRESEHERDASIHQPQEYRLRVGDVRVFYDVTAEAVEVLAIVTKIEAARWLAEHGAPDAPGGSG